MFKIAKSRYPSIWMCISPCGCWTEEWINKRLRKNYRSQFSSKDRSQLPKAQRTSKGAAFRTGSEHLARVSLAWAFTARPWDTPALRTAGGEGAWPFGDTGGEFNQHQEPLRDFPFCEEMASVIYISWIFSYVHPNTGWNTEYKGVSWIIPNPTDRFVLQSCPRRSILWRLSVVHPCSELRLFTFPHVLHWVRVSFGLTLSSVLGRRGRE